MSGVLDQLRTWRTDMSTYMGYTQKKLDEKAEKRGITTEAYKHYLALKYKFRSWDKKPDDIGTKRERA
jgi:hypothetical protein